MGGDVGAVADCKNTKINCKGQVSFHSFPKENASICKFVDCQM